jgi:hypothetical protein
MIHFGQRNGAFHRQAHNTRKQVWLGLEGSRLRLPEAASRRCKQRPSKFCLPRELRKTVRNTAPAQLEYVKLRLVEPFPEYPTGELTPSSLEQKRQSAERRLSRRAPYQNPECASD